MGKQPLTRSASTDNIQSLAKKKCIRPSPAVSYGHSRKTVNTAKGVTVPVIGTDIDEDLSDFEQPPTSFTQRKVPVIQPRHCVIETLFLFSAGHFSQGSGSFATSMSSTESTSATLSSVNTMKQVALLAVTHQFTFILH